MVLISLSTVGYIVHQLSYFMVGSLYLKSTGILGLIEHQQLVEMVSLIN